MREVNRAHLRGKFIATNAHTKQVESSRINYLTLSLKELGKGEQMKPRVSRRREIIKIKAAITEIENRKTIEKTNKTRNWVF